MALGFVARASDRAWAEEALLSTQVGARTQPRTLALAHSLGVLSASLVVPLTLLSEALRLAYSSLVLLLKMGLLTRPQALDTDARPQSYFVS